MSAVPDLKSASALIGQGPVEPEISEDRRPTSGKDSLDFRVHPWRAVRAMRRLIANKEDTAQVFEIMRALRGKALPRGYARLLQTPGGGEIAWKRQELCAVFSDAAYLDTLPDGTVGHAYRQFTKSENISAEGLTAESMKFEASIALDHPLSWYARRLRDVHDIWHVLTGYGRDALGEACVVAFSFAITRSPGFAFIAFVGALRIQRELKGYPVIKAVWQAYRDGSKARWLPAEDYVRLLAEPLDAARRRLNIPTPVFYLQVPEDLRAGILKTGKTT